MLPNLLFGIAFVSQIVLISVHCPRRLRALVQRLGPVDIKDGQGETEQGLGAGYSLANHSIGAIGLVLLAALLYLDTSEHMTAVLLSIGLFFLLQLSPLALPDVRRSGRRLSAATAQRVTGDAYRSTRLRDLVGALPVGMAAVLGASYLAFAGSQWSGALDTHLLKMAVFTSTQVLFAGTIAWSLSSLKRATPDQAGERYQGLKRLAPLLVFASVMISVYYFGKELLAGLDEPQLRPTMMSAFLQLLAVLAFDALYFARGHERPR